MLKEFTAVQLERDDHRKLKFFAAGIEAPISHVVRGLFNAMEVIDGMKKTDPEFRKRYLAIFESALRDMNMGEAKLEEGEGSFESRVESARIAMHRLMDRHGYPSRKK